MSRLFLPLLANQFDVLELLWQEIHRYGPRRDRFSAANRQNRTNPIEIPWRNSCKIATAAKSDTPGCRNLLGSCQYEFRALDLSATSGTHDLNPSIKINVESPQRYRPLPLKINISQFVCKIGRIIFFKGIPSHRFQISAGETLIHLLQLSWFTLLGLSFGLECHLAWKTDTKQLHS